MLTSVRLQAFKAHASTRIALSPLSVLVGPNAVGKTSVLSALHHLGQIFYKPLDELFIGPHAPRWLVRSDGQEPAQISICGAQGEARWEFSLTIPRDAELDDLECAWLVGASGEDVSVAPVTGTVKASQLRSMLGQKIGSKPPAEVMNLGSCVFLRLDARKLAAPSYVEEEVPRLEYDGYGLATVLSSMKLTSGEAFQQFEELAQAAVPALKGIGFKRTRIRQQERRMVNVDGQLVPLNESRMVVGDELVLDFVDARELPAHAASEGTLLVLGILAALMGPARPKLVLLDDIERALHPKAQRDLVAGIRKLLGASSDLQILATTHSPYLADALTPEELVVLGRTHDGSVAARRLSEHPKAQKYLDVLTTGEFWSAEGEDWVE
jgi:predicted ATPase